MSTTTNLEEKITSSKDSAEHARIAARVAVEEKALDVRAIELAGLTDVADCFVIASGTSDRHCKNVAEKIRLTLRELGEQPIANTVTNKQNREKTEWIVLDYGHLVIHVFYEPTRQYYKLDELWKDAKEIELGEETNKMAEKLRTGIYSAL